MAFPPLRTAAFVALALLPVAAALPLPVTLPAMDPHPLSGQPLPPGPPPPTLPPSLPPLCIQGFCIGTPSSGDAVQTMQARFPRPTVGTVAVWDGTQAHILFGGGLCFYDVATGVVECLESFDIYHYDPATDTLTEAPVDLETGLYYATGVWTGDAAYVFGGCNNGAHGPYWGCPTGKVVRYEPATETLTVLEDALPYPVDAAASFFDGRHAYIVGGCAPAVGCPSQHVLRFDPTTETAVDLGPILARPEMFLEAVWTGEAAYLFGGASGERAIDRFDPAAGTVTPTGASLPRGVERLGSAWDGSRVLAFGGWDVAANGGTNAIVAFTPSTGEVATLAAVLPSERSGMGTVWVPATGPGCEDGCAYLFGGRELGSTGTTDATREIVRFGRLQETGGLPRPPLPLPAAASLPPPPPSFLLPALDG